jgi:hypothetical protein
MISRMCGAQPGSIDPISKIGEQSEAGRHFIQCELHGLELRGGLLRGNVPVIADREEIPFFVDDHLDHGQE